MLNETLFQQDWLLRQWGYALLAESLYQVPGYHAIACLAANIPEAEGHSTIEKEFQEVVQNLEDLLPASSDGFQALQAEHSRLFPLYGEMLLHPWESVYRDVEHALFDEHTLDVSKRMKKYHLGPAGQGREPADHIGMECSFLATLSRMAIQSLQTGDEAAFVENLRDQASFLNDHILAWSAAFFRDLRTKTTHPFYQAVADFAPVFFRQDLDFLSDCLASDITLKQS